MRSTRARRGVQNKEDPMKGFNSIAMAGALSAAWLATMSAYATAQDAKKAPWRPEGTVEFVVGSGPGGENARLARSIQHVLPETHLVDSNIVLNKPGAGQIIAMNYLAGKAGDATKIGLVSGSFVSSDARRGSTLYKQ